MNSDSVCKLVIINSVHLHVTAWTCSTGTVLELLLKILSRTVLAAVHTCFDVPATTCIASTHRQSPRGCCRLLQCDVDKCGANVSWSPIVCYFSLFQLLSLGGGGEGGWFLLVAPGSHQEQTGAGLICCFISNLSVVLLPGQGEGMKRIQQFEPFVLHSALFF